MRLRIIGCTGSMSGTTSPSSSYLVEADVVENGVKRTYSLVMDLGSGAMGSLMKYIDPRNIDAIAFSHLHADHCVDIVGMHVYRKWHPDGELPQIPVYSPEDGKARVRGIDGGNVEDEYDTFRFEHVEHGSVFHVGPMTVECFDAWHTIPALAFRITGPSENGDEEVVLVYTGDTDLCDSEIDAARGADLLLCEAAFEDGRDEYRGVHMNGERAGILAREADVKRVVLTHIQPWTNSSVVVEHAKKQYAGPLECAVVDNLYSL
ncbi:MAG: MBL fold metallo-hydrolase [Actinomycetaceae bacterium]|nr:MBL fold metallo-hydrolase [Actinomycetaceae bacterium]